MASVTNLINELTTQCCIELFAHYGVHVAPASTSDRDAPIELAGIIGFARKDLRGAVILGSSASVLEHSHVRYEGAERRDWVAELANQLLGRVKNRLVARGVDIEMTTPLSLRGQHLTVGDLDENMTVLDFRGEHGWVRVWIDLELSGHIEVRPADENGSVAAEGDMMLF
jgi:CheY-specific phosphatase CheX